MVFACVSTKAPAVFDAPPGKVEQQGGNRSDATRPERDTLPWAAHGLSRAIMLPRSARTSGRRHSR